MTFKSILEPLGYFRKKKGASSIVNDNSSAEEENKFKYLLSILDSIAPRKLHCTGQLYAIILSEGARNGGLFKKIASLLQQSRDDSLQIKMELDGATKQHEKTIKSSWVNLFEKYTNYRDNLDELDLPPVRVRIHQKEIRQVLFAEQSVTYNAIRKNRRKILA